MTLSGYSIMSQRRPKRTRRIWVVLSLIVTLAVSALLGLAMLEWSRTESLGDIQSEVSAFAARMRLIRPLVLLLLVVALPYLVRWMAAKGWVSVNLRDQVTGHWPRIAICVALIEITIGQGALFVGGTLTILYLIVLRVSRPKDRDAVDAKQRPANDGDVP